MSIVNMVAYKVNEISFVNNVNTEAHLNLGNKISHNANYDGNENCIATLNIAVCDENQKNALHINISVSGIFAVKPGSEKEFVHVETFKELFPFAKALIATITANAGIPAVYIPNINIEDQPIISFDPSAMMGNDEENEE